MKINEVNKIIDDVLVNEVKKIITEQIYSKHVVEDEEQDDPIQKLQTLSGLVDKISNIENIENVDFGLVINVDGVTEDDIINCCGGNSLEDAEQKLMQGLHHDLEDGGLGNNCDIDLDVQEDNGLLNLKIRISTGDNDLLGDEGLESDKGSDDDEGLDDDKGLEDDDEITPDSFANVLFKAREEGKEKFMYENEEFDVNEYWNKMEEEEMATEKKGKSKDKKILLGDKSDQLRESKRKKTVTLNEKEMKALIERIIIEASEPTMDAITRDARDKSAKENADYLKMVEKKIKDYLSFKGNDNPEFPHQIGQGDDAKVARQNTEEQDEIVSDNRGRGPQDLDYDTDGINDNGEPPKAFQDRMEKALKGDTTMGNSQDALNVVKTDTGEKMWDTIKRRRENLRKEPIYPKEPVPVKTKPENEPLRPVNEEDEKMKALVAEDIEKMKKLVSYNKKTQ